MSTNIEDITLSDDQQNALDEICAFIVDPAQPVFVLEGFAGTGKSTLVSYLLDLLPKFFKLQATIDSDYTPPKVELTATTNKACEALASIAGAHVATIHSLLKLRLTYTAKGDAVLSDSKAQIVYNKFIIIDEASFLDRQMIRFIFEYTKDCKILFMGDPAQLSPVKSPDTPVFNMNWPTVRLEKIMRQASGNPIIELSTLFRMAVTNEQFPEEVGHLIDGKHIRYLDRDAFNDAVRDEFTRPEWRFTHSKVLAWTNRRVIEYNHYIRDLVKGDPEFEVGDYASVNAYCLTDGTGFKTDQMVQITKIEEGEDFDTPGKWFELDGKVSLFMPASMALRKEALKRATVLDDAQVIFKVKQNWVDLRAVYACTVNKSQGSTYDKAFIDLDDIGSCRQKQQVARMLYVAFSRARFELVLTGDLR
jgi:ATP-dependent exoDNAse (exonuclease V) alpha subunit